MNTSFLYSPVKTLAQLNYGEGEYNSQVYSCQSGDTDCITTEDATPGGAAAPNTGFLGMSQSAAIATTAGALLVAVAIVGIIFVVVSRVRHRKSRRGE
jgi:hypothetical protein